MIKEEIEDEVSEILEDHWEGILKERQITLLRLMCAFLLGFAVATIINKWVA